MKTYIWANDGGHEWLAVKAGELINLGIADKISTYSYVKGNTVYLEGDCDAAHFYDAYRAKYGVDPKTKQGKHWDRWPGRSFPAYSLAWIKAQYPHHNIHSKLTTDPVFQEPGETLQKFIDDNNRWIEIFGKQGMTFPLSQADAEDLGRTLDSQLSPENLHCDGEISPREAQKKYDFLTLVADELNIYCDANGLMRPKIYEL